MVYISLFKTCQLLSTSFFSLPVLIPSSNPWRELAFLISWKWNSRTQWSWAVVDQRSLVCSFYKIRHHAIPYSDAGSYMCVYIHIDISSTKNQPDSSSLSDIIETWLQLPTCAYTIWWFIINLAANLCWASSDQEWLPYRYASSSSSCDWCQMLMLLVVQSTWESNIPIQVMMIVSFLGWGVFLQMDSVLHHPWGTLPSLPLCRPFISFNSLLLLLLLFCRLLLLLHKYI